MCKSPVEIRRPHKREARASCGTIPPLPPQRCGWCEECIAEKVNDWKGRCIAEVEDAAGFHSVTLTYGRCEGRIDHVRSRELVYRDVQKLFKKLRRKGFKLSYLVAGEYGDKFGRAHWHVLFFWHDKVPELAEATEYWNWKFWKHGYTFVRKGVGPAVGYVTEYVQKGTGPENKKCPLRMSKVPSLGARFFERQAAAWVRGGNAPLNGNYTLQESRFPNPKPGTNPYWIYRMFGASLRIFVNAFDREWAKAYPDRETPNSPWLDRTRELVQRHEKLSFERSRAGIDAALAASIEHKRGVAKRIADEKQERGSERKAKWRRYKLDIEEAVTLSTGQDLSRLKERLYWLDGELDRLSRLAGDYPAIFEGRLAELERERQEVFSERQAELDRLRMAHGAELRAADAAAESAAGPSAQELALSRLRAVHAKVLAEQLDVTAEPFAARFVKRPPEGKPLEARIRKLPERVVLRGGFVKRRETKLPDPPRYVGPGLYQGGLLGPTKRELRARELATEPVRDATGRRIDVLRALGEPVVMPRR